MTSSAAGAALGSLGVFGLFLASLAPSIFVGDAGELVSAAYLLGIPHPPGYPTFSVLLKVATLLPLGNVAFRVNVGNAALGMVLAWALWRFIVEVVGGRQWLAWLPVALVVTAASVWAQATVAEVYLLNLLFMVVGWRLACLAGRQMWLAFPWALLMGIGLGNHHTLMLLMIPMVVGSVLWRLIVLPRRLVLTVLCGMLGVAVYVVLPLRSAANPLLDWGNCDTVERVGQHVFRKQYGAPDASAPGAEPTRSLSRVVAQLKVVRDWARAQWWIGWWALAAAGCWIQWRRARRLAIGMLCGVLVSTLGIIGLSNFSIRFKEIYIMQVFFLPSVVFAAIWIGEALVLLFNRMRGAWGGVMSAGLAGVIVMGMAVHWPSVSRARDDAPYWYGWNLLIGPPAGSQAMIFTAGDNPMFLMAYHQMVEDTSPHVTIYDDLGNVFWNIYGEDYVFLPAPLRERRGQERQLAVLDHIARPAYYTLGSMMQKQHGVKGDAVGLLYRVQRSVLDEEGGEASLGKIWRRLCRRGLRPSAYVGDYLLREMMARYRIAFGEWLYRVDRREEARRAYEHGRVTAIGIEWLQGALAAMWTVRGQEGLAFGEYLRVLDADPNNAVAYNNLGVAYLQTGKLKEAKRCFDQAVALKPSYADAHNNLGFVLVRQGQLEAAERQFRRAVSLNPYQADALANLADLMVELGQLDEGMIFYHRAVKANPRHTKALMNMGGVYARRKAYAEAERCFQRVVALDPGNADAHNNLGSVYGLQGKLRQAIAMWKRTLELDPAHADAARNLEHVRTP